MWVVQFGIIWKNKKECGHKWFWLSTKADMGLEVTSVMDLKLLCLASQCVHASSHHHQFFFNPIMCSLFQIIPFSKRACYQWLWICRDTRHPCPLVLWSQAILAWRPKTVKAEMENRQETTIDPRVHHYHRIIKCNCRHRKVLFHSGDGCRTRSHSWTLDKPKTLTWWNYTHWHELNEMVDECG